MFELRNDIIHGMKDSGLTISQAISLADNTLNVMDAAPYLGSKPDIEAIDSILISDRSKRRETQKPSGKHK